MTLQEILDLSNKIKHEIANDPENGLEFFKKEWGNLTFDEKMSTSKNVTKYCNETIKLDDFSTPQTAKEFPLIVLCCRAVLDFINKELEEKPNFGHLKRGPQIKQIDIAAVFKLLHDLKYITNSLPEIENIVMRLFDLKDKTTMHSYLNNPDKIAEAKINFKNAVTKYLKSNM